MDCRGTSAISDLTSNPGSPPLRRLKAVRDIAQLRTTGSLSIARQLLAAGLVDRLRILTFPLLAGSAGREPAFADIAAAELQVTDTRVLDGRIQLAEYRPTERDIPRGTEQREPTPR